MEGDLTWGGEHTIQCTNDALWNCAPETYKIMLTIVTTKKFLHSKGNHQQNEKTTHWMGDVFVNDTAAKELISKIYKEFKWNIYWM